jgi:hypothetical protein
MGNATSAANTAEQNMAAARDARKLLSSDFAREKLNQVLSMPVASPGAPRSNMPIGYQRLGNGNADELLARLDAEAKFAQTTDIATGNSATARRQQTMKELGPTTGKEAAEDVGRKGMGGMAAQYAYRAVNALLGGHLDNAKQRQIADAVRLMTAQGASRDRIAGALMLYGQNRAVSTQGRDAISRVAQQVLSSPTFAFIDEARALRELPPPRRLEGVVTRPNSVRAP